MKKLLIPILFFAAAMTAHAHCGACAADHSHDKAAKAEKSCCGKCGGDKAAKAEKSCCGKCGGDKAAKAEKSCCGKCGGDKTAKSKKACSDACAQACCISDLKPAAGTKVEIPKPKMACCPA